MFISRSPSGAIRKDRHGCAWADVNQDGLLDFYCSVGANHGKLTDKANELWMQQPGGGFLNKAAAYGVTDPLGPGRQVTFLDVNHDPFPDLYVTNHAPRPDGQPSPNRLFINQNGASFRDAPEYGVNEELGSVPGNQSCAQAVDYNKDGWGDLFVCGHTGLRLYRNNGGVSFTDVTSSVGIIGGRWRHARMADLTLHGTDDLTGTAHEPALAFRASITDSQRRATERQGAAVLA
jgi:hypothetical protein